LTLDACVRDAQRERIILTRRGIPVALVVGIEGLDEEQVQLGSSNEFWKLITERRNQKTISRTELEKRIDDSIDV
jgi:hypothetical protein